MQSKKILLFVLAGTLLGSNNPVCAMSSDKALAIGVGALGSIYLYNYGYTDLPKPDYLTPSQEEVILQDRLQNLARTYHNFDTVRFLPISTDEKFISYEKSSKIILFPKDYYARWVNHIRLNPLFLSEEDTAGMSTTREVTHPSLECALRMEHKEDITKIEIGSNGIFPLITVTKKTEHPMYLDQAYLHRYLAVVSFQSVPRAIFSTFPFWQAIGGGYDDTIIGVVRRGIFAISGSALLAFLSEKYLDNCGYDAIPNNKRLLHAALQYNRQEHEETMESSIIPQEYWEKYPSLCSKLAHTNDYYAEMHYFKKRLNNL